MDLELAAGNSVSPTDAKPAVEAIFIAGQAEHWNKESLLQFSTSTPVFAVSAATRDITWLTAFPPRGGKFQQLWATVHHLS